MLEIVSKINEMKFSQFLEMKFLQWQQAQGGRKTVKEFSAFIGVSQSTISSWWNGDRSPEGENISKIADKLGVEVYDVLEIPRPDPDLFYIQQSWGQLDPATRKALRVQAEAYQAKNLKKKK